MTVFYYFFLPSVYMQKSVSITYRQKSLCVLNNSQGLSFLSSLLPQIQKKKSVSVSPINNPLGFDFRQREICSTSGHKLHGKESPKGERSSLCVVIESGDSTLKISTKLDRKVFYFVPFNLLDLGVIPSLEREPAWVPWLHWNG